MVNTLFQVTSVEKFMKCFEENWCELEWTPWIKFSSSITDWANLPGNQGVYRVRPVSTNLLAYVGQTGRNLKERLSDLRRNTLAEIMPFNDPHTAAPNLWVWRKEKNWDYECSAATTSFSTRERLALECFLLWQYRLEKGESTLCNHGRFHLDYHKSRGRKTGIRGKKLAANEKRNPAGGKSHHPLTFVGKPLENDWMGLVWSKFAPFVSSELNLVPKNPGGYRIVDSANQKLLYIGETKNLQNRFRTHRRHIAQKEGAVFSFSIKPFSIQDHELKELENDLIGAYYTQTKSVPIYQFSNTGNK